MSHVHHHNSVTQLKTMLKKAWNRLKMDVKMKKVKSFSSVYCSSWPCNCITFLSFNFYTRDSLKCTWFLLMKGGIFFYSLVSRNCVSKIAWWLIRILRDIVILLKRKWCQMKHRGLLMLRCHGVSGGKFFSEIDSNEYFLIKHNFDFFKIFYCWTWSFNCVANSDITSSM